MSDTPQDYFTLLTALAKEGGLPLFIRGTAEYEAHVQVKNLRLKTSPLAIAPCAEGTAFSYWLRALYDIDLPISIRSGGHHHEGMCSNDGGIVLLATDTPAPQIDTVHNTVWLGAGQQLEAAIEALGKVRRMLPTGGCENVNVGGLTHGGGWGMSYRTWGLTSDALRAIDIVLPNGDMLTIEDGAITSGETSLDVDPVQLFWAVRGGGGGNFGVVTRFKFDIFEPPKGYYVQITLQWEKSRALKAASLWAELAGNDDHHFNSFARFNVLPDGPFNHESPAFVVGGRYYGTKAQAETMLKPFLDAIPPNVRVFEERELAHPEAFLDAVMLGKAEGPRLADGRVIPPMGYAQQVTAPKEDGPARTCDVDAEPHKVSSLMPGADVERVLEEAFKQIAKTAPEDNVSLYLSLHGMGGAGGARPYEDGAFPWREEPFILQVQAWWNPGTKDPDEEERLVNWVIDFREALAKKGGHGAFINFPDRTQPVQDYYGGSWDDLLAVKAAVDIKNKLAFPMGIPGPN